MRWGRIFGASLVASALLLGAYAAKRRHRVALPPADAVARQRFFEKTVRQEPTAGNFKLLAESSLAVADYDEARVAYAKAADVYRAKNLPSEGYATDAFAERYEVQAVPYVHLPTDRAKVEKPRAKFEPAYGCYVGAFIDHEDSIHGTYRDEYGTWRRDASAFNHLTGVHHALFFMYLGYGRKFPAAFLQHMKTNRAAAQIAWEPKKLDDVQDNAYLHEFARKAKKCGVPIFLRFASEMNGDWVPYNGDPTKYVEKFRLVARIMHAEAPNVAMVWCPFETPVRTIANYYPGAAAVDWVGLNVYSVPFWDNDPKRPAHWRNPSDSLRFVYDRYAARHPMMICEYGASHRSSLDGIGRSYLARTKLAQFYASLPRRYPRVKAVCWLSMNAIKHALPGRQSNDYSLLDDDGVRRRYEEVLRDPYFLRTVPLHISPVAKQEAVPLVDGQVLRGRVSLSSWVKLYNDAPRVIWRVNGEIRQNNVLPGPHRWVLDTRELPVGDNIVELTVLDNYGNEVADEVRHITVTARSFVW